MKVKKSILHLTVKKEWFDKIKSGRKRTEYREIKPYWTKRLCLPESFLLDKEGLSSTMFFKDFDFVKIKNGYSKKSPELIFRCGGISVSFGGDLGNFLQFSISLEDI
jgi:hypothetical protein